MNLENHSKKKPEKAAEKPAGKSTDKSPENTGEKVVHTANGGGASKKQTTLREKIAKLSTRNRILAGVAGGLCVALLCGLLVYGFWPEETGDDALIDSSEAESILADADVSIDVEALPDKIEATAYVGTILPEGDDAGMDYCEETLFLGDSNTQRMLSYADVTGVGVQNGIGVVSMGINTFTTFNCVRFTGDSKSYTMPQAVGKLKPRRVVITFGTNNVGMNMETFIAYYEKAIEAVRENYEYCDIIIGSVFPVDQYRQNTSITMPLIDKMNVALVTLAGQKDVKFLNWSEAIFDEDTGYSGFEYTLQDGVHLTRAGMEAIFKYLRTHAWVTEDTRPAADLKNTARVSGVTPTIITKDPGKVSGPIDWSKVSASDSGAASGSVTVQVSAYDKTNGVAGGGTVSAGGSSGGSITLSASPGSSLSISASAKSGYEFVGWSCSVGSASGASGPSLSYTVPSDISAGTTISITAIFKPTSGGATSSGSDTSSSVAPSSSSQAPSSTAPPSSSVSSAVSSESTESSSSQQSSEDTTSQEAGSTATGEP